jgi:hypothetical protein
MPHLSVNHGFQDTLELMSAYPLIFPSLTRQPSMDSSKNVDDDTIRDQAESGYTATRPRFSRGRRTWKINVRNLVAEDIRALDQFFMVTAARGLFPNLLANGSFEFPAVEADDLVAGWNVVSFAAQESIAVSTVNVADGTQALQIAAVAGSTLAAGASATAEVDYDQRINCTPGEIYVFTASVTSVLDIPLIGTHRSFSSWVGITFFDSNGALLSSLTGPTAATLAYGYQFTVPAGAAAFKVGLFTQIQNTGSSSYTPGALSATWDSAGCSLQVPLTAAGRMAGSAPLGCLVRFSKLPEVADIGMGNGVKMYGANFELTEV